MLDVKKKTIKRTLANGNQRWRCSA